MLPLICGIACSALTMQALVLQAQFVTNGSSRVRLLPVDNIASARSPYYQGNDFQRIATNTPAFEEYGFNAMLSQANRVREKWQLDIAQPLTFRNVYFWLKATPYGIEGSIGTRDGRYHWGFDHNAWDSFQDASYCPYSFQSHWDEEARLAKIKSKITAEEAEAIARDSLQAIGLSEAQLNLKPSPEVNQYKFQETNAVVYPLPIFNITWRLQGQKNDAAENLEYSPVTMDVSGITKQVVNFHIPEHLRLKGPIPPPPIPTNYLPMLGLPTNYFETLPNRIRKLWGLAALTNAPLQQTNSPK